MSPRVTIDPAVGRVFPDLTVHALTCDLPAQRTGELAPEPLAGIDPDQVATHPAIAPWRNAMKLMGLKPAEQRSSVEQLLRRALKGMPADTGVPWVNAYNALSVTCMVPMGGYDLDLVPGPVTLRPGQPGRDQFRPLGGDADRFPISENVMVYASGNLILCWALNVRDSGMTCLHTGSRRALFISEAVTAAGADASVEALSSLANLVLAAGGSVGEIRRAEVRAPV